MTSMQHCATPRRETVHPSRNHHRTHAAICGFRDCSVQTISALAQELQSHTTRAAATSKAENHLIGELPKIRGTLFWGPYNKDPTI